MQPWMILSLWLVYLVLTGDLGPSNLVVGLLIAIGVAWLLHPDRRKFQVRRVPGAFVALLRYLGIVIYDMISSALQVARILLHPELPIEPGIIAIPSGCDSELATALSAHSITLAPGELVIEIDRGGIMYTHTLDVTHAPQYTEEAQRLRRSLLSRIFP
jgi:multicomponent Na+:H+ antiporter subunit E